MLALSIANANVTKQACAEPPLTPLPEPPSPAPSPAAPTPSPTDSASERSAEAASEASANDEARLQRFLDLAAGDGRGRLVAALVDAANLAVDTPIGVILAARSDPGSQAVGVTLLVRSSFALIELAITPLPTPMETLRKHFNQRRLRGESPAVVVAETEGEWQNMSLAHRRSAVTYGVIDVAGGGAEAAAGMYLLLANQGVLGMTRGDQTAWGIVLAGVGMPAVLEGIVHLLGTSGPQWWWNLYQGTRWGPPGAAVSLSFGAAPVRGGASGVARLAF